MYSIKGMVKNGVIHLLDSVQLPEGQSVTIVVEEEDQEEKLVNNNLKLSELLLLPELEEEESLFERSQDTGRDIVL